MDAYTRRARLAPALIMAIPGAALAGAGVLSADPTAGLIGALLAAAGVAIAAIVRDAGRRLEPELWSSWGGQPSRQRLRWREAPYPDVVESLHRRLNRMLDVPLPSREQEMQDPAAADRRYDEAVAMLRERTRDKERFNVLFDQNADYGFRRNCLGIRSTAVCVALGSFGIGLVMAAATTEWLRWGVGVVVSAIAFWFWARVVSPEWVRESSERYADRLFESIESLRN